MDEDVDTAQRRADSHDEVGEARPLLPPTSEPPQAPPSPGRPTAPAHRTRCRWPWIYVVLLVIALAIVSDVGEDLYVAPRVRLFESVVCVRYYSLHNPSLLEPDGSVPEHLCKIDPIQSKAASVLGWQLFFDGIPAVLLPIPYGYLADRHGRKWILVLALIGYTLGWASTLFFVGVLRTPIEYVWMSSLFYLVGGGPTTGTTLLTTVVADVVPPGSRSTVFFYRFCTDLVADLFVPPLASFLMSKDPWIPLLLAVLCQSICVVIALGVPETLPLPDDALSSGVCSTSSTIASSSDADGLFKPGSEWKSRIQQFRQSFDFVIRDASVFALVFTFLISKVGRQATNVLFQYVSKKYGWTLSQAGLLVSLRAGVNIALFTVILPFMINFAFKNASAPSRDLWIGKISIVLLMMGAFIMFASETAVLMCIGLVISALGMGFAPIIRSLVTFLVESHHASSTSDIGRLYALISVMEGVGSLVSGPAMAWAFGAGMELGRDWLGLPFGIAGLLFALVTVVVFRIKV
ncbi:major facilitator superfamily domain-containing protein [Xylariaceae sp. FL0804]|nr:major facilitator superfamily domain-containing protein [Xylariaceae sp. FL0804]